MEFHPLLFQLVETPVDNPFFELEIRYTVAKNATDPAVAFENRDRMAQPPELLRNSKSRRARSYDRNLFSALPRRRLRYDPASLKTFFDDCQFNIPDRYRSVVY